MSGRYPEATVRGASCPGPGRPACGLTLLWPVVPAARFRKGEGILVCRVDPCRSAPGKCDSEVFLAKVRVTLKPTVNDPQGITIARALGRLGYDSVESLRVGKYFELKVDESDRDEAERQVAGMCDRLLANPVIERFEFELEPVD